MTLASGEHWSWVVLLLRLQLSHENYISQSSWCIGHYCVCNLGVEAKDLNPLPPQQLL